MKKIILLVLFTIILTGCENKEKEESKKITETNGMISYTIDGEKTDIKPTKEEGYIVNKIICDNGSDMMWDNDNWEVELTKINSKDRCKVDFTKDTSTSGYRITVTSNMPSALDSLSKATTENGTVIIYSTSKIESVTECSGIIEDNKVIINNVNSNQTCNVKVEDKTLASVLKKAYPPQPGRTKFNEIDNGNPSLYTGEDDLGTTYYFSGDGTNMNNWVSFANKMWRVIRINGNSSVRLLYAGTGGEDGYLKSDDITNASNIGMNITNSTSNGEIKFNSSYNHPAYAGWRYSVGGSLATDRGNAAKSKVYMAVENWYSNLSELYKNYIDSETVYCSDREIGSGTYNTTTTGFYYSAYLRVYGGKPVFKCSNISDKFYIFGLITIDEIMSAGGVINKSNEKAYYCLNANGTKSYSGKYYWWTMTPANFLSLTNYQGTDVYAGEYVTSKYGEINSTTVNNSGVVRPVISLKPEVQVTGGDGSGTNPYTVILP